MFPHDKYDLAINKHIAQYGGLSVVVANRFFEEEEEYMMCAKILKYIEKIKKYFHEQNGTTVSISLKINKNLKKNFMEQNNCS